MAEPGMMKDDEKTHEQLLTELAEMRQRSAELEAAEAGRAQVKEALQKRTHQLGERVKELNCLFGISNLVERPDISLEEILQGTVDLIPPAWQYSKIACARLVLDGQAFRTEHFEKTPWTQRADIFVHGELSGTLEVCYLEHRPESDEGPFLNEEKNLLNAIAQRLGRIIGRMRAEEALKQSENRLRQAQRLAQLGHWDWYLETGELCWSEEVFDIFGQDPPGFQPTVEAFEAVVHPDDLDSFIAQWEQALVSERDISFEHRILWPDGTMRHVQELAEIIRDDQGQVVRMSGTVQDITEWMRMDEALRESEEEYRMLFETMAQGVVYQSADGKIASANSAAERILGLTLDQMRGRTSIDPRWKAIHQDGSAFPGETHPSMVALKSGKKVRNVVMGVFNPLYEEYRWININAVPQFRPGESAPYQVFTTFDDITERVRAENELRQRTTQLETLRRTGLQITSTLNLPATLDTIAESALNLVDATSCHIYLYDEVDETFTFGTALWRDGRREPAMKTPPGDSFPTAVVRERRVIVLNDAAHHPLYTTPEAPRRDVQAIAGFPLDRAGRIIGVFTIAFLEPHTFNKDELRVLGLLADQAVIAIENAHLVEGLEEQVAARTAQIRAEQEKSETILRSVGDAIVMTDREMRIRYVNPAFTTLTGYAAQEVLGKDAGSFGVGVGSEQVRRSVLSALARGEMWQGAAIGRRKDGRRYDATLTVAPVCDADGRVIGYVSSHQDITRLKDLDRARSHFIANVSHQLRTPVTNIKLYAQLLRKHLRSEKAEHYAQVLEDQSNGLVHLIQDILEITELDSGQAVMRWEPFSLHSIIKDAITHYQSQADASGLTLTVTPTPSDLPPVTGDQVRLYQALGELVENAVTFTPADGQVTIEAATVEDEGQRWVTIAVRDTGPGISLDEQEQLFDRFFRGSLAESGHIPGTGLGLSIAQEIVRAHGGRVTVASEVGRGSAFTIWLPITPPSRDQEDV